MFGYVRPYIPDLRVREHELYRAMYCGLCRSMGRVTGQISRFTLNYDFVFLTAVRFLATGNVPEADKKSCMAHPLKKRLYIKDCPELRYSAGVSALLLEGKLSDDVSDEKGFRKLAAAVARPCAASMQKKTLSNAENGEDVAAKAILRKLSELSALEIDGCTSLDCCAEVFGVLTGEIFSAGLPEREARICREIGRGAGRFIYVADAADDIGEDFVKGRFNPILALYGEDAVTERDGKYFLSEKVAEDVNTAMMLDLERCAAAAELLCDGGHPEVSEIVRNIIYAGMPETIKKITS